LAKTSERIRDSGKELTLIADKVRIIPTLSQFSVECRQAIKKGSQICLIFEGDKSTVLLKEKVNRLIDGKYVHIKFNPESIYQFVTSDDGRIDNNLQRKRNW
jgi:hypothetical protein